MNKSAGGRFADTMIVRPNSWHGRMYQFWQRHAEFKNSPDYRENLCHYSRVVLIWAPLTMVRIAFLFVYDVLSILLEPVSDVLWRVIDGIGGGGRRFGGFIGRHGGSWVGRRIDGFVHWFIVNIMRGKKVKYKTCGWGQRFGNMFLISLLSWGLVAGIIYLILHPLQALMMIGIIVVAFASAFLVTWGGTFLIDNRTRKGSKATPSTPIRDTIQLAGHMIVAKKRGICPYIVLETEAQAETMVPTVEIIAEEILPIEEGSEDSEERELVPA